jgi:hypothetical protein
VGRIVTAGSASHKQRVDSGVLQQTSSQAARGPAIRTRDTLHQLPKQRIHLLQACTAPTRLPPTPTHPPCTGCIGSPACPGQRTIEAQRAPSCGRQGEGGKQAGRQQMRAEARHGCVAVSGSAVHPCPALRSSLSASLVPGSHQIASPACTGYQSLPSLQGSRAAGTGGQQSSPDPPTAPSEA